MSRFNLKRKRGRCIFAITIGMLVMWNFISFFYGHNYKIIAADTINQSLKGTIYHDNEYKTVDGADDTKIVVSGELPQGSKVKAYKVNLKIGGVKPAFAYDITIFDNEGKEIQPQKGDVSVKITNKKLEFIKDAKIYHIENKSAEPELISTVENDNSGTISFSAKKFSIYAVEDAENLHYNTFMFYDETGKELEDRRVKLTTGEILKEPGAPQKNNAIFDGWYTMPGGAGEKYENWIRQPALYEDKDIKLYANYRYVYNVYYQAEAREGTEDNPVMTFFYQSYSVKGNRLLNYSDIPFQTEEGKAVVGWSKDVDGKQAVEQYSQVNEDMTLYPIIKDAYWITFDSEKGSFIDPVYVLKGEKSKSPKAPIRPGYKFVGWYEDKALSKTYSFDQIVNKNTILHAKWEKIPINYTVIYWQQNSSDKVNLDDKDKTYSYFDSETRTGYDGEIKEVTQNDKSKSYKGFHYNGKKQGNVTVKADGSAVLNVYYDRDVMTINFYKQKNNYYSQYELNQTLKGLYGSSFLDNNIKWPETNQGYRWEYTDNAKTFGVSFLDSFIFPNDSTNSRKNVLDIYEKRLESNGWSMVRFYKENVDGSWNDLPSNLYYTTANSFTATEKYQGYSLKHKKLSHKVYERIYSIYGSSYASYYKGEYIDKYMGDVKLNDRIPINQYNSPNPTYNYEGMSENGNYLYSYPSDLGLYFYRKSYNFRYLYARNKAEINGYNKSMKYEERITSELEKSEPTRPIDSNGNNLFPDYYKYRGWFKDPNGQEKYNFNSGQKIKDHDEVVYAFWSPDTVKVTFDPRNGENITEKIFNAGDFVPKPDNPQKANYDFAGWTLEDGTPFNFSKHITEDTKLVARWISKVGYRTTYDPNTRYSEVPGAEGKPHQGPKLYVPGAPARVVSIGDDWGWSAPDKAVFYSWNTKPDGTGKKYYPGQQITLDNENLTLYAIWTKQNLAPIHYDLNYINPKTGAKPKVITTYHENNRDTLLGEKGVTEQLKRPGYRFLGWSKESKSPKEKMLPDEWNKLSNDEKIRKESEWDNSLWQNGKTVRVNTEGIDVNGDKVNTLYAHWSPVTNIKIITEIEGNMADSSKEYEYQYDAKRLNLGVDGKLSIKPSVSGIASPEDLKNLRLGTKVSITGNNYSDEGYKLLSINGVDEDGKPVGIVENDKNKWSIDDVGGVENITVTYKYRKNIDTPTGLKQDNIPFVVGITVSLFMAYIFLKGRNRHDGF
ncbi:InlB B-repeat-containing protein [Eubacteriales bacterium KG125]